MVTIMFKIRTLLILTLMFVVKEGSTDTGGILSIQFLCFRNYGHLNIDGIVCDEANKRMCSPQFRICVSHQPIQGKLKENTCPIFFKKTHPFSYKETICDRPVDNRGSLAQTMEAYLPFPLQDTYFIRINVKDSNEFSKNNRYIGRYSHTFIKAPYSVNDTFIDTQMSNFDKNDKKTNASLRIGLSVKCIQNSRSDNCSNMCQTYPIDNFTCSGDGKKMCKKNIQCYQLGTSGGKIQNKAVIFVIILIVAIAIITIITVLLIRRKSRMKWTRKKIPAKYLKEYPKPCFSEDTSHPDCMGNIYDSTYDCIPSQSTSNVECLIPPDEYSPYLPMSPTIDSSNSNRMHSDKLPSVPKE